MSTTISSIVATTDNNAITDTKIEKKTKSDIKMVEKKDIKEDSIGDYATNYFLMMSKFVQIYNTKHSTSGSLIDGVDLKDKTSTNDKMETFFEYIHEHRTLETENKDLVNIYDINTPIENMGFNTDEHEIYTLVEGNDKKPVYVSLSFISLLMFGVQKYGLKHSWSILKL
jgi:hypothetical protein